LPVMTNNICTGVEGGALSTRNKYLKEYEMKSLKKFLIGALAVLGVTITNVTPRQSHPS